MHRQANFYAANWPKGTTVAEDGDIYAFYLPEQDDEFGKPVLGGGEFIRAFADRPRCRPSRRTSRRPYYANAQGARPRPAARQRQQGPRLENLVEAPIDKLSVQILQDPKAVFRFDASDLMPAAVGSDADWKQVTAWITVRTTQTTLDKIEAAWPKS